MAKVVIKAKTKKVKRKYPLEIVAPEFLGSYSLGKSDVVDLNAMVGKTAKVNLMYISGNVKNQNIRLVFQINEVNSGLAKTEVVKYEQIPYYLGRFIKKDSDLIEDSFVVTLKDGKLVRMKPFMVTKQNASKLVLSTIRKKAREVIENELKEKNYEELMNLVISGRVQNTFRNEIRKVFPLKVFEFRKVELK